MHGARAGRAGLRLAPAAEDALQHYAWPGNVRELENVMQRAVILAAAEVVEVAALLLGGQLPATGRVMPVPSAARGGALPLGNRQSAELRDVERQHILATLAAVGGSRKLAGQRLGMPERTLRHKLRQYREEGFLEP
jgi:two-component system response regulator FlrC